MGRGEGEGDVFRGHPRRVGDEACATDVVTDVVAQFRRRRETEAKK